tara:strand:+ start:480 stop:614 length:135 start_codon:yes stop_codon:yes gene_type:complete
MTLRRNTKKAICLFGDKGPCQKKACELILNAPIGLNELQRALDL